MNLNYYMDFAAANNPERGNWNEQYRKVKFNRKAKRNNQKKMRGL